MTPQILEDWRDDPSGANLGDYAVVFSGGGAHGAWEIGCLRALCDSRMKLPKIRAGTSAGALNAAGLTSGMSLAELEALWTALTPKAVFHPRPHGKSWSRIGLSVCWSAFARSHQKRGVHRWIAGAREVAEGLNSVFDSEPLKATLREHLVRRYSTFAASPASVVFAVTDTGRKQPHYFYRLPGRTILDVENQQRERWHHIDGADHLIDALMATSALPFLFPPKGALMDGGILRNQPLGAAATLAGCGEPMYVLLPQSNQLPDSPNIANMLPMLLEFWLGSGLRHELELQGIANVADDALRDRRPQPVCVVRATQSLDGVAGLLDFGKGVSELVQMGEADMKSRLKHFDPEDSNTWEPEVQP